MINTICGTIKDIHDDEVQVLISRKAACANCEASKVCHSLSKPEMDFRLPKPDMPLAVGDQVIVALESVSFLKACTYAFLVPLCAIILALSVTELLNLNEIIQAISAAASFIASLFVVRRLGKRIDKPRIIEVINEG
ncbi:MAG TPA: SoxR reducing system RseC family protein [Deltaproteobacteria bacterium]|nr:SoxR reducing system RseC family protein [Deltaproteobacteria bacterium]